MFTPLSVVNLTQTIVGLKTNSYILIHSDFIPYFLSDIFSGTHCIISVTVITLKKLTTALMKTRLKYYFDLDSPRRRDEFIVAIMQQSRSIVFYVPNIYVHKLATFCSVEF